MKVENKIDVECTWHEHDVPLEQLKTIKTTIKMTCSPDLARQFFNIMGAIVDEFRLSMSKDGWKVAAVDPANVALALIDLPKDNFESYECDLGWTSNIDGHPTGVFEENIAVGIDVDKIKEFFGGFFADKSEIILDEELNAPVEFTFSKSDKGDRYELQLKQGMFSRTILLIPTSEIRREPKNLVTHLDYKLQLNNFEFQRICKKAGKVGDYIRLAYKREESDIIFTASTEDSDGEPWDAKKHIFSWQALSDKPRDSASSLFSLDYLCDIVEKIPSKQVWLHIGQDWPCALSFVLGRTGTVEYKIAPRIESE